MKVLRMLLLSSILLSSILAFSPDSNDTFEPKPDDGTGIYFENTTTEHQHSIWDNIIESADPDGEANPGGDGGGGGD